MLPKIIYNFKTDSPPDYELCMKHHYGLNDMGLIKNLTLNFIVQVMILNKNIQNLVFFKEKIELK